MIGGGIILKIGHRGIAGLAPENTKVGFEKAIELGLDMVELDIQLSKDNKIVVFHDHDLERIAGVDKLVKNLTLEQLKEIDVGSYFNSSFAKERILTLEEVIDLVKDRLMLNIEIKMISNKSEVLTNKLVQLLRSKEIKDQVIISSFKHSYLLELGPEFKTAVIINSCPIDPVALIEAANADGIHPNYNFVTKDLVQKAKQNNYFINVWTINSRSKIKQLKDWGVDGVVSDIPNFFF